MDSIPRNRQAPDLEQQEMSDNSETLHKKTVSGHKREEKPLSSFMCVVKNFSLVWWTIAMDTGVLGVILHQFPYPSHWTKVCSTIMFVLNVVLFLTFSLITILHWSLFWDFARQIGSDYEQIALQACPAIAWLTITIQVQLICAESWGYGFSILAYVMWWIGFVWVFSVCLIMYLHLVKAPSQEVVDRALATAVFIPIVGCLTVANAAGLIVNYGINDTHWTDRMAVPMILIGFMVVGFALSLGFVMYSIYTHRLMTSGWPAALKIPSMILTIGPCGQSASALLQLGNGAVHNDNFARYAEGFFLQKDAASIVRIICVVMALMLLGFALWWICIDYYAIFSGLLRREIHPSLFWWSSIFPVGTVVTAMSALGADMNSPAFKVCAVILFTFLFCVYVLNTCFTIPMTLSGELLGLPKRSTWLGKGSHHPHPWAGHSSKRIPGPN